MDAKIESEVKVIFDQSIISCLGDPDMINIIQFYINQMLASEQPKEFIIDTPRCRVYVMEDKNNIIVYKGLEL